MGRRRLGVLFVSARLRMDRTSRASLIRLWTFPRQRRCGRAWGNIPFSFSSIRFFCSLRSLRSANRQRRRRRPACPSGASLSGNQLIPGRLMKLISDWGAIGSSCNSTWNKRAVDGEAAIRAPASARRPSWRTGGYSFQPGCSRLCWRHPAAQRGGGGRSLRQPGGDSCVPLQKLGGIFLSVR